MAQSMQTRIPQSESEVASAVSMSMRRISHSVNMETVDEYHQYLRHNKRSRVSYNSFQCGTVESVYPVQVQLQQRYPLEGPSPLGLKLNKSPSLVELIQGHLAQSYAYKVKPANSSETICSEQKESKSSASNNDKLKASNIPASLLKIGNWEYKSMHEGDLVAKCYFAKHKLVWEILKLGLKSKIEIQWSDITGLKADCPEIGESSLLLMLSSQPLFFRETNPQPRKHTLWQPCSDFTNGEATRNRFHFLKIPQGTLQKHYEKLIQSDSRLNILSQQKEMVVDSPYFESEVSSVFSELGPKSHLFDPNNTRESPLSTGFPVAMSSTVHTGNQPTFLTIDQQGHCGNLPPLGSFSPSSVMPVNPIEGHMNHSDEFQGPEKSSNDEFKEQAELATAMSKLDIMNCLVNLVPPVADPESAEATQHKDQLKHITEYLLNDSDLNTPLPTDDKSLMARVNSLCNLLVNDNMEGSNSQENDYCDTFLDPAASEKPDGVILNNNNSVFESNYASGGTEVPAENPSMTPETGMMTEDSFSDVFLNLPLHIYMNLSEDNQSPFD